jgi:SAM-dependent methyltransferase
LSRITIEASDPGEVVSVFVVHSDAGCVVLFCRFRPFTERRNMPFTYDPATLELLTSHVGEWTEDLVSRLDPNGGVATGVTRQVRAFVDPARVTRLLDFGCGAGASSLALARLLPHAEIVGVELNATHVELGNHLRTYHNLTNLRFIVSPSGDQLPADLGQFDVITLCAVYEHLLPHERRQVLPLLWNALKPGGVLLVNGTPYRWFPLEHHTTGLPLLNYLPDRLAHALAQRIGKYPDKGEWASYLRAGIRGGTEWSVLREIGHRADVLQPREGNRAAYWLTGTSASYRGVKRLIATGFAFADRLFGTIPCTHLEIAIRKPQ